MEGVGDCETCDEAVSFEIRNQGGRDLPIRMKDMPEITRGGPHTIKEAAAEGCVEAEQPKFFTRSNR